MVRGSIRLLVVLSALAVAGVVRADPLLDGFRDPPASARPRVWWHWMNGNVTEEGIRLDLAWMKRVGLGGFQAFDADLGTPQLVARRLSFMSPEWKQAFGLAARLADQSGLEMAIASSPGWSETGGPWVTPQQAMKKLVWSEVGVTGGGPVGRLPPPPSVTGPFQDISGAELEGGTRAPSLYRDVAVIAFPTPADDVALPPPSVISSSAGPLDSAALQDGSAAAAQTVRPAPGESTAWIRFDYSAPQEIRAITLAAPAPTGFGAPGPIQARLEASTDGRSFRAVAEFALDAAGQRSASFPAVTARAFRVVLSRAPGGAPPVAPGVIGMPFAPPPAGFPVAELVLRRAARINAFEDKAGFAAAADYDALATPASPASSSVAAGAVVDLTGRLRPDGTLDWAPPAGHWTVLRLGYSLTGHRNGPAAPEATGLEADKLNAGHVRTYLDHYLALYRQANGRPLGEGGVRALLNDSIEAGAQNWTEGMLAEFRARRGYDPTPWLPALTGRIVADAASSDRFLWDFRRTIADLLAQNHYGEIAKAAKANGLTLYGEALEDHRPQLGDDMEMRRNTSVPMAAMWTFAKGENPRPTFLADIRGAASVAHVYGQNIVAAESLTAFGAPWAFAPRDLKHVADLEFALGVNRIAIHTSPHQPLVDAVPGMSLAPTLGQYFSRTETWAEQARPWIDYLARSSFLLQQGHAVADLAYFYGEEAPLTGLYGDGLPKDLPRGHGYDFVNADVVLTQLSVQGGRLVTATGMSYRLLYLGGSSRRMTLPVLRRLQTLVAEGGVVVGERPTDSPSLADDRAEFERIADLLWPDRTKGLRRVGAGRVGSGMSPDQALATLEVMPDVAFGPEAADDVLFVHRRTKDADIYFLTNQGATDRKLAARFRAGGEAAEAWDAVSGRTSPMPSHRSGEGVTVSLDLPAYGSRFVLFRAGAAAPASRGAPLSRTLATLTGPWTVMFQAGRGAPAKIEMPTLASWSEHRDPGVRYFSGTATYVRTFRVPPARRAGDAPIWLDLGQVRDLAEVRLNGRSLGILWTEPFRIDVSQALRTGENRLEVRVTNLWVNRLIGDAKQGAARVTVTNGPTYRADAPLRPSGLLGPVSLQQAQAAQPQRR